MSFLNPVHPPTALLNSGILKDTNTLGTSKKRKTVIGSGPWDIVSTGLAALYIYIPLVVTDSLTATLEFEQKE